MSSGMRSWVRALMLWWRAWRTRTRNHRPSEEFVDHTLADVALSRADVDLARAQVRRDMSRMMRHFEVDPDRIAPAYGSALRSAERICANCLSVGRCRHWLHDQFPDTPPLFCPNAQLYENLAGSQKRRTRLRWRRRSSRRRTRRPTTLISAPSSSPIGRSRLRRRTLSMRKRSRSTRSSPTPTATLPR
jgi:uncharacterized protein YjiS (DUF1127 family)